MELNVINTYQIVEQLTLDSLDDKVQKKYINLTNQVKDLTLEIETLQEQIRIKQKLLNSVQKKLKAIPKATYIPIVVDYNLKELAKQDGLEYDPIRKTWYANANKVSLVKIQKWLQNEQNKINK
jgi:hypothetical protein